MEFKIRTKYTVKEAAELFFEGTVSKELIYKQIYDKKLAHVKVGSKVLLDADELKIWWENQLKDSVQLPHLKSDNHRYGTIRKITE